MANRPKKETRFASFAPAVLYRCRAETSVVLPGYSKAMGPGSIVDLDEEISPGQRLRDVIREDCFEPIEETNKQTEEIEVWPSKLDGEDSST